MYKRTDRFKRNQDAKPMYASRDPQKRELRFWETKHGHVNEVAGRRIYRGACEVCDDVVLEVRDVSSEEFRGKGNAGWRGRWPALCDGCRERRREESLQRRSAAKRKADRERIADKREMARDEAESNADGRPSWSEAQAADEAADRAKWAQEDREAASRYRQRRGMRSPYDRV
ncbi:hypothetical protein [Mycolicibacterium pyrenivorans]|uniref:hypothetical protein n=1 Tax=Mycolicibacterium pyrenivorans TaxID=187102 RepID=UPI0021F376DB|nr:hypothetical protein [Mycolicibacterium pyrenivorans]MCV7150687.1 hypothetical protein [Mycolicibacterium pyrenivorans]